MKAVQKARSTAWIVVIVLAGALDFFAHEIRRAHNHQAEAKDVPASATLKRIYAEVKELGPYPGESLIRHDFFLGPADDDSYKKEHIVVLIQVLDGVERMRIQVTEMKTRPDNPRIQLAGRARTISCSVSAAGALALLRSDYSDRELVRMAPDILRAVLEKKKLLKEFGGKAPKDVDQFP